MKIIYTLFLTCILAACGGGPTVPDWQVDTQTAIARYTQYYLEGRSKLAAANFAKSRAATASTGNIAALGHLELVKCGVQVAALDLTPCQAYSALAASATTAADTAYYQFIRGEWQGLDTTALPPQYVSFTSKPAATPEDINQALQNITDPLSRLVASGVAIKRKQFNLKTLQIAADTASAQGWRRPLLAYLLLQQKNTTDRLLLQQIQSRIEIVESSLP